MKKQALRERKVYLSLEEFNKFLEKEIYPLSIYCEDSILPLYNSPYDPKLAQKRIDSIIQKESAKVLADPLIFSQKKSLEEFEQLLDYSGDIFNCFEELLSTGYFYIGQLKSLRTLEQIFPKNVVARDSSKSN